jgi:hypothetical protein
VRQFSDKTGRLWTIELTIGNVVRVRKREPRFDLLDPVKDLDGSPLQVVLTTDPAEFYELLWLLCEPQLEAVGIDPMAFGQLLTAEHIVKAQAAFVEEWTDFFRSLHRDDAAMAVETQMKLVTAATRMLTNRVAKIDKTKVMTTIEGRLESEFSKQFGRLQESLESIQDPTPGVSSS